MGLERKEAIRRLKLLKGGEDLHILAHKFEVTVVAANGKINKGWAGQVLERYLGMQINSSRSPNAGSWELKSFPLKYLKKSGALSVKETMAITMIDPVYVMQTPFEDSHLLTKLKRAVFVARIVGDNALDPTTVYDVYEFDLFGGLFDQVKADYEEVQKKLRATNGKITSLTGAMGKFIQPRTKGRGNGSESRAFYARPIFLRQFINRTEGANYFDPEE